MTLHLHHLEGCSPDPLAHYLKGLGILRLIVEQRADCQARVWWQDEHFCLLSKLTRDDLEKFFLERYEPTPLLSPWNKGCGLFTANDPGLAPLENSKAARFGRFRDGVAESRRLLDALEQSDAVIRAIKARTKTNKAFQSEQQRQLLASSDTFRSCLELLREQAARAELSPAQSDEIRTEIATITAITAKSTKPPTKAEADRLKESPGYKRLLAAADRRFKSLKVTLIPDCRRTWRGGHAEWLAAAVVLDEQGNAEWPSLLGTGGNDGRLDFTNNFMQRLGELFDLASTDGGPSTEARELLANSLWAEPSNKFTITSIGQYQPGAAGGANSTTGPVGDSRINPWDFVLMMEGSLLFSARATRCLDPNAQSRASAPFAVRSHAAGFASTGAEKAQRGEQWMPLWARPAALTEVVALFGEARVQLNRQTAHRPIDVARAISRLGVARGIDAFTRYGYLERNGQSTLAVPLGRVNVRQHPHAHLIDDLASWLDRLQRRARDKHAPARLVQAERRLADAVFAALTHDSSPDRWQAVLRAAAAVEALQSRGTAIEAGPIPPLRLEWISAVGDTPEVRLALALGSAAAGYSSGGHPIDSIRHHWLPLEPGARRFKVADGRLARDSRVVMSGRDLLADCAAVVERRLIEAGARGERRLPLVAATGCSARLDDLAFMLSGRIDLDKLMDLGRAFMAIKRDARRWPGHRPAGNFSSEQPEEAWLALRLACLPWPLSKSVNIPTEPGIVRRLLAGDSAGAIGMALARLRSAGVRPPLQAGVTDLLTARLWAAALVFPIDRGSARRAAATLDPTTKGEIDV